MIRRCLESRYLAVLQSHQLHLSRMLLVARLTAPGLAGKFFCSVISPANQSPLRLLTSACSCPVSSSDTRDITTTCSAGASSLPTPPLFHLHVHLRPPSPCALLPPRHLSHPLHGFPMPLSLSAFVWQMLPQKHCPSQVTCIPLSSPSTLSMTAPAVRFAS